MIRIVLNGRLGNQMFQYAFGIAAAKELNTRVAFEKRAYANEVKPLFQVEAIAGELMPGKFRRGLFTMGIKKGVTKTIVEEHNDKMVEIKNNTLYEGFFQNEDYFIKYSGIINNLFRLNQGFLTAFKLNVLSDYEPENTIIISVRLGDYRNWTIDRLGGRDLSLPVSYYQNAIVQIPNFNLKRKIILCDEPDAVPNYLSFITDAEIAEFDPALHFQLMLKAQWLIIPNSTFAWWAAWLNPNEPKVLAPQYWLGFKVGKEFPAGIMSKKFKAVPVF